MRKLIKKFDKNSMDSNWIRDSIIYSFDSIRFERLAWPRFGFEFDSKVLDSRTSSTYDAYIGKYNLEINLGIYNYK